MKIVLARILPSAIIAMACLVSCAQAPETKTPDQPKDVTPTPINLSNNPLHRRAVEAVNWGIAAVNYERMYEALVNDAKGASNQIVYWPRRSDWKNQALTPNPELIYLVPFIDTKDTGAMILEIPAAEDCSVTGTIIDCWQAPLKDLGLESSDNGKGAKYLILPPSNKSVTPSVYSPVRSDTYENYAFLRILPKTSSETDLAKAVAYGKRLKLYPLTKAKNPPATTFVDASNIVFDSTIPYDTRFFQSLDRIVQKEPWLEKDKVMIDMLQSLGIEKGKPFNPDPATQKLLEGAAGEAHTWLDARYESALVPYYKEGHWAVADLGRFLSTVGTFFEGPDTYTVDSRAVQYSFIFGSIKHTDWTRFYLISLKDKQGDYLDGHYSYRLKIPARVPASGYWSAVAYDRATHSFIRNVDRSGYSSRSPELKKNADGSVDLYFGPSAPPAKESNWVPTNPNGKFEVIFRIYLPEKPFFEKTWKLPDLEKLP